MNVFYWSGVDEEMAAAASKAAATVAEGSEVGRVQSALLKRLTKIVKESETNMDMAEMFKDMKVRWLDFEEIIEFPLTCLHTDTH